MKRNILTTLLWTAAAVASPILPESFSTECRLTSFSDTFDDRISTPLPITALSAVGTEGGLDYTDDFWLMDSRGSPFIQPPSQSNFIFTGLRVQERNGQAHILPARGTVYFNLEEISYACGSWETAVWKAASCKILVVATGLDGTMKAKELVYEPGPVTNTSVKEFSQAVFPSEEFKLLTYLTITVDSTAGDSESRSVGALFDSVGYHACIKS